jgi:hypothetical protein
MKRPQIVVSTLLAVGFCGCNYSNRRASNEIVAKVEQFKESTGRVPDSSGDRQRDDALANIF